MSKIIFVSVCCVYLVSCAGSRSYRQSGNTFSMGSNLYIEGGLGNSKVTGDELNLEYEDHSVTKYKASIDLGIKLWEILLSYETGRIFNDFKKSIYDETVAGDYRLVESFRANSNFQRISLMRKSYPARAKGYRGNKGAGFFSFQLYYDFDLESNFYNLPDSEDKKIEGTAYGVNFGMHLSSLYYKIGYNWREYEANLKMEEMVLSIGLTFLIL